MTVLTLSMHYQLQGYKTGSRDQGNLGGLGPWWTFKAYKESLGKFRGGYIFKGEVRYNSLHWTLPQSQGEMLSVP